MEKTAIRLEEDKVEAIDTDFRQQLVASRRLLRARAQYLAHSSSAADDLVQETLERALRNSGRFMPGTNMLAWLTSIMRNLFADKMRHLVCERRFAPPPFQDTAAPEIGPWDLMTTDDVKAVLPALPELYRRPFEMVHFEKRSLRQTSEELGIPISTVGTRTFRARSLLRRLLLERHAAANNNGSGGHGPDPAPAAAARPTPLVALAPASRSSARSGTGWRAARAGGNRLGPATRPLEVFKSPAPPAIGAKSSAVAKVLRIDTLLRIFSLRTRG